MEGYEEWFCHIRGGYRCGRGLRGLVAPGCALAPCQPAADGASLGGLAWSRVASAVFGADVEGFIRVDEFLGLLIVYREISSTKENAWGII